MQIYTALVDLAHFALRHLAQEYQRQAAEHGTRRINSPAVWPSSLNGLPSTVDPRRCRAWSWLGQWDTADAPAALPSPPRPLRVATECDRRAPMQLCLWHSQTQRLHSRLD